MAIVARILLTLLLAYLCLVSARALLAYQHNTWGKSYYVLVADAERRVVDQRARHVSEAALDRQGVRWEGDVLTRNGQALASYSDGEVRVFRASDGGLLQSTTIRWFGLAAVLAVTAMIWRRRVAERWLACARSSFQWLRPPDLLLVIALLMFSVLKIGIIDMVALGSAVEGLQFGLNYYVHDVLIGASGKLTIYPYNPASLIWMQALSGMHGDLQLIGVNLRPYGLVSLSIAAAYIWLCLELTVLLNERWRGSTRMLFFVLLLNPFGLYYSLFLGQVDVIVVALLVAGARRVFVPGRLFVALGMIVLGLVFAKPQHMLVLPALAIAMMAARTQALKGRVILITITVTLISLVIYWLYTRVPAFVLSLATNPQSQRIGWATWFQLLGDSLVVNRPLAFLAITFLVLAYRVKHVADGIGVWQVAALATAALTAWFQASYAHTFGMAMLMFPALMLLVLDTQDRWRAAGVWLAPILLLLGWGTGEMGDVAAIFGGTLFSPERVNHIMVLGMSYPSLLATLEASAYMAFGVMLVMRLLGGPEPELSAGVGPGR
ncbi:hypothetical protein N5C16_11180 [Stenotrophomonas sp. GD03908]|uniref:Uncharacterized protein n=1 Tax=Stenotrophomonas maltophilia TaxID=40324 RepID=A0AAJ2TPS5_STEMA|nr:MULTISPECIES: hypothetical protein [Stenotrophomonas]MBH1481990.1 hypothetical protein [Stenotrophomonas maltophilia]MCU1062971.1 hypothetical protein [Stenotrophomonas maltophilia]MDH0979830.1 hypothetical protein [Stenotrophomonas sp. GD03908]MDQ7294825.1 hypothetical protein [Stenotrophomonas sp. Sm0041]MDZ5764462.1 hypothetical protein [Stenotrophomonas maltophilia]